MNGKNDLLKRFLQYIADQSLFHAGDHLLLAVSGGVDSVVLCDLCSAADFRFSIAHCNFALRGAESDRDESFVRQLGERYQVPVMVKRFDTITYASAHNKSIQVAARELRYQWFGESLKSPAENREHENITLPDRPRFILTAHHADDNIETVMMNFFKGTGISGLRGILPKQGNMIRPLLFAWKEELSSYADKQSLSFVEDSSNALDKYTRNYFRNQLIPGLQAVYPAVKQNLHDALQYYVDTEYLYQEAIALHLKKLPEKKGNEVHIPVLKLKKLAAYKTILYEVLKPYHFTPHQCKEATRLLASDTGKFVQSSSHRIVRNRKWLVITPVSEIDSELLVIESADKQVTFRGGLLHMRNIDDKQVEVPSPPHKALLDASLIKFPLILRRWKQGDYFYPLGMKKKKKISRFLIDQKASLPDKENTWVLEMDKKIIWVVNRRIDDRFKLSPSSKDVLQITFTPTGS